LFAPVYSFIGLCIRCMSVCMPASAAVARVLCDLCRVLVRLSARTYVHTYATRAPSAYVDSDSQVRGSNQRAEMALLCTSAFVSDGTVYVRLRERPLVCSRRLRCNDAVAVNAVLHFAHGRR
jgi:hypothetical protein